jgi:hypothetical protein
MNLKLHLHLTNLKYH